MRAIKQYTIIWLSIISFAIFFNNQPLLAQEQNLEAVFQRLASEILDDLRNQKIGSTGVLKFAVRIGEGKFPPNLGTLNMRLAEKLEVALVLANPARIDQAAQTVAIARNASEVAESVEGANHLTGQGRAKLFSKPYPLAFKHNSKAAIPLESLIVGIAQIHEDLSKMEVQLGLITPDSDTMKPISGFSVPTDLDDLVDAGESFSTRGIYFGASNLEDRSDSDKIQRVISNARQIRTSLSNSNAGINSTPHPLSPSNNSPVNLNILYDNVVQPLEFRNGAALVREPRRGQKVSFTVRRNGTDDKSRYGILLKVNGENTLYREKKPNAKSTVWVLRPDLNSFDIRGFQLNDKTRQDFLVLSESGSRQRSIDYGQDVGMISLVVYRERDEDQLVLDDDVELQQLQAQIALPKKTFDSRNKLATNLFAQLAAQTGTRGLIVDGAKSKSDIRQTTFKRDLTPVLATSVRYYRQ